MKLVKSIADKQTDVDQLLRNVVFGARQLTNCLHSSVYLTDPASDSSVSFTADRFAFRPGNGSPSATNILIVLLVVVISNKAFFISRPTAA